MCFGGGSSTPAPAQAAPVPETVAATPASDTSGAAQTAQANLKKKASLAKGTNATLLTGPQGLTDNANVKKTTLLGQSGV